MKVLSQLILICLYPLLVLGRIFNCVCKSDPLRLRQPRGATCWIERGPEVSRASYFSEASEQEGKNHRGFGRLATAILGLAARLFAPTLAIANEDFGARVDRERDIPDEVYTLW
jgi:hypothetical protein